MAVWKFEKETISNENYHDLLFDNLFNTFEIKTFKSIGLLGNLVSVAT